MQAWIYGLLVLGAADAFEIKWKRFHYNRCCKYESVLIKFDQIQVKTACEAPEGWTILAMAKKISKNQSLAIFDAV